MPVRYVHIGLQAFLAMEFIIGRKLTNAPKSDGADVNFFSWVVSQADFSANPDRLKPLRTLQGRAKSALPDKSHATPNIANGRLRGPLR